MRERKALQKGVAVALEIIGRKSRRINAKEVQEKFGISSTRSYQILNELCDLLGMYKDGVDYVMLDTEIFGGLTREYNP